MRCEDIEKMVFSGEPMNERAREAAMAHAAHCEACRALMENADVLCGARELDEGAQPPQSFCEGWRAAIRRGSRQPSLWARAAQRLGDLLPRRSLVRGAAFAMSAVVLVGAGAALGGLSGGPSGTENFSQKSSPMLMASARGASNGYAMSAAYAYDSVVTEEAVMETASVAQKVIRTAQMTLKTQDMDETLEEVARRTAELGGSIARREVSGTKEEGRWAHLELRIPAEHLDAFLSAAGEMGTVTREMTDAYDATREYYDNESRLESARAKKAQLDALYAQATDMTDIIAITDALFDVQAEIDNLTGANRYIDSRVSFSEVSLTIDEEPQAVETEPASLLARLYDSLLGGAQDLAALFTNAMLALAWALPWLAALALLGGGAYLFLRRRGK